MDKIARRGLIPILFFLFSATCAYAQGQTREDYLKIYSSIAVREMKLTGIPASITLAQACLESNNGNSRLAVEANNHFGIKCHNWKGETITEDDDEKGECFRKYSSADESFRDHSDFLRYRDRYASLFDLDPNDYKGWAHGLKQAGYATDPQYAYSLIRIIEDYHLSKYDNLRDDVQLPPSPTELEKPQIASFPGISSNSISLEREVLKINGSLCVVAYGYETWSSIASEYGLFKAELMRFNEVTRDEELRAGEIVFLQPKKSHAADHLDKHFVEEGETIRSLSQRFGIKMKYLYQYNGLRSGQEPKPGTILLLRKQK